MLALRAAFFLAIFAGIMRAEVVSFPNQSLTLRGVLYRPPGPGPFPAVLYNHGSARDNTPASDVLGPLFASRGWVFFMPHRRGQGLSSAAGPYIRDTITAASRQGGLPAAAAAMVRLLETDHLSDQLAALAWLQAQPFVSAKQIAVMGNSFGGVEALLGVERAPYCAAVDLSGGAESWAKAPALQTIMSRAARQARAPVLLMQPENDYDLGPTRSLAAVMKQAGKPFEVKIYPRFGNSPEEGHSFAYRGAGIWIEDATRFLNRTCGHGANRTR